MPCCIAIIHFLQCNHKTMFKLGCTKGCSALCEPSQQATLLVVKYLWRCDDCHNFHSSRHEDQRTRAWEDSMDEVHNDKSLTADTRLQVLETMHKRERLEEKRLESSRTQQVEEIQWVTEWTHEYGEMLWDVMYGHEWESDLAAKRVGELRALKLWDMVVVRDVLRTPAELEEQQDHTPWLIVLAEDKVKDTAMTNTTTADTGMADTTFTPPPPPTPRFAKLPLRMGADDTIDGEKMFGQDGSQTGLEAGTKSTQGENGRRDKMGEE
ncbi:hypothetical protein HJFPF1_11446 [Paramyrothecium foliicola]|nr:hypothetical protein HJFPF1_11446 [Paramyrothecium foliicola]